MKDIGSRDGDLYSASVKKNYSESASLRENAS
jgi:hypothetical protein